ncbi:branched-chain amino acid aminotransferase [Paraoerskovia marina]|uniref:Branched-chain amino acid aminotransferase n=1 Tax=Paraoerskovia marina TaxID=545619 RepID=A0A1H1SHM3_9CELL|nr:aminotransferase class IV [Paraoerskovia marina]SDS47452.1 branched-chain amino acid aminotransferase [Paraoerskovia marina]
MTPVIWVGGVLVDATQPSVSAVDHGVTVGDGVFETCRVDDGAPFALTRHLARLRRSAEGLGLDAPDDGTIRCAVREVLAAAPDAGRLRITVTAGLGPLGSQRTPGEQTIVVAASEAGASRPARVVRAPWVRNERSAVAGLKTTSYAENVVALRYASERGGDEAVLANTHGELCEGTGSNVFVERGGELLTPPLSSGCLAGITRELLLEWAADDGLAVREAEAGELGFEVLDDVLDGRAQLLITNSVRDAQAVTSLDGVDLEAGPVSLAAEQLFARRRAAQVDP